MQSIAAALKADPQQDLLLDSAATRDSGVLSACNTAAEDGRGDEVMSGLARGFFYAGRRALLVTHRAVESESAKMLTTETFRHYVVNPGTPKAESLRQPMLRVMELPQFRHPVYGAPQA